VAAATPAALWSLRLEARGVAVDEAALRLAVARELARADVPAGAEPVQIEVSVAQGGSLMVRYRNPAGAELYRSVAAPTRADEVPEVSALLVGNLARDEASSLLAELARQRQATAAEPVSSPVPALTAAETPREVPPALPLDSVNLSLFYPLTLRSGTEQRHLACELGLFYSRSAALSGLSLTAIGVSRVDGPAHGLQLGGIGYWHGGPGIGVRLGGLFGASSGPFDGLSAAGFASLHRGELMGVELASFTSVATGPLTGVQAAGFFDYAGSVSGVQAAGFVSLSAGPVGGVQAAGFASISTAVVDGVQIAAGTSIADDVRGLQLSLVNIGGSIDGAQIGLVNVADDVTGLQLGLVNVAHSVKGQSIGFVPYNREGGLKIVTWYDSTEPFNLGVRFHAGALYVMPTFAFDPGSAALVSDPGLARYAIGTSIGLRLPIERMFVDIEANASQPSQGWKAVLNENTINLRYRVLAGYRILPGFSVFAGGGLRQRKADFDPELSVGMELL
ncbi:MAG: hypothetical protein ABI895_35775, partial [Deltaproteobacteria bacterium]